MSLTTKSLTTMFQSFLSIRRNAGAAAVVAACLAASHAAAADDQQSLTAAFNQTGQQLFLEFRDQPGSGNIVFSPYSIGSAMAMVLAGARGDTERETAAVLHLGRSGGDIAAASAAVGATLNGYDHTAAAPICPAGMALSGETCDSAPAATGACPMRSRRDGTRCVAPPTRPDSARLSTANALMLGQKTGDLVAPGYAALLKDKYGAEIFRHATLDDVNGWVRARTEGKIEKLIDQLDPSVPAVILNAVYFKAAWRAPFNKGATAPAEFNLTPARRVQVATMRLNAPFAMRHGDGYRAIRLPYTVAALSMTVVVPDKVDGLAGVARRLDANELSALLAALRSEPARQAAVALPRFKTSFRAKLGAIFQGLGMRQAFDLHHADFSGITGRPPRDAPLAISDVIHQAVIDVTEDGTEAAAATAVVMMAASLPPRAEPFAVDRPFLFVISDDATGAILFEGRVTDPR